MVANINRAPDYAIVQKADAATAKRAQEAAKQMKALEQRRAAEAKSRRDRELAAESRRRSGQTRQK